MELTIKKRTLTILPYYAIIAAYMKIIRGLTNLTKKLPNPVLTIGNFDGVHLGHQAIIKKVVERSKEISGTSIVLTFEPHPLKVIAPERSPKLLNTFLGKMNLIAAAGIDVVIIEEFTIAFAEQNPDDFARTMLHEKIAVQEIYVGYDYAFGRDRKGSISSLKKMGRTYGFYVGMVEAVQVHGIVASSSAIRDFVASGKVEEAARLLGRYYAVEGEVVHGSHRGHELGFPTANLRTPNELLPTYGVYAVLVHVDGSHYQGVASIGVRPTFDSGPLSIEVYLFDFNDDIYGKQMDVSFVGYLREEKKFADAQSLIYQMQKDVEYAKKLFLTHPRP